MVDWENAPTYILAGGKSARLGRDKARVIVDGQTLVARLAKQVGASGVPVSLVADHEDRFADLGLDCLVDAQCDAGPLAGLVTALRHRQKIRGAGWLLLLSCDSVQWDRSWLDTLLSQSQAEDCVVAYSRACDVVLHPEPMPALYHTRLLDTAAEALHNSSRSLKSLIQRTGWKDAGPSPAAQWSFNTEEELQRVLRKLQ